MIDILTGVIIGGAIVYFMRKPGTNIVLSSKGVGPKGKKKGKEEKPLLDLPYFQYKHVRPDYDYYDKGTYDGIAVCSFCYRTTHKMTDGWPGDCPDCGTSYSVHQDLAGKWLNREGKWLLSPIKQENPYPVPLQYEQPEQPTEKDITPEQKKLQDNS